MSTRIPPDFEESNILAATILDHLNLNPDTVDLDTLAIHIGPDNHHAITWDGHATITTAQLLEVVEYVRAQV